MSLRDERLRRLHKQFLDAAEEYPDLRFAAATDRESNPDWPVVPRPHGDTIGLSDAQWGDLLLKPAGALHSPLKTVWLRLGERLWEGAFFDGTAGRPIGDLRQRLDQMTKGVQKFLGLADSAAGHFDMPATPCPTVDFPLKTNRGHRWLEAVCGMPLVEADNGQAFLLRTVRGDIFTASARTIDEGFTVEVPSPAPPPAAALPHSIWSVEDYYRAKDFYDKHGAVFNPALMRGSPAEYHVRAQAQLTRAAKGRPSVASAAAPEPIRAQDTKGGVMGGLADDPQVAELLLLLWDAPDREAGIAVVDLPESLREDSLLTACEGAQLIHFARRNHCHVGGGVHSKLVLEGGWNVADLHRPGRKQAWQMLQEAIAEDVPDEIRLRMQLGDRGSVEASRLAFRRTRHQDGRLALSLLADKKSPAKVIGDYPDVNEGKQPAAVAVSDSIPAKRPERSTQQGEARMDDKAVLRLLSVFTNGLTDERFDRAKEVLGDANLTTNEKLTKIDAAIRFPPTASGEQLGYLVGVSKQAVFKTDWWIAHRKGQKANEIGRRQDVHRGREERLESDKPIDQGR